LSYYIGIITLLIVFYTMYLNSISFLNTISIDNNMDIEKEIKKEEHKIEKAIAKVNLWAISSAVLAVILIAVIFWPHGSSGMPSQKAGENLVTFLNTNVVADGGVELVAVEDLGSLYLVNVTYQGQDIPVYTTKDGKYFIQGATEITDKKPSAASSSSDTPAASADVPKTDKPIVEAFVFTYCPYGLQFEKALSPVYNLLKAKADINIVQIGAMHGEYEQVEAYRQLCIQKNYGKDKLWAYLNVFMVNDSVGNCGGDMTCSKPLVESIMKKLSMDVAKINTCMDKDAKALYDADGAIASSAGASGSPTFRINGVDVSVNRDAESIKKAICDAFTTAPSECSETLSTAAASPGFGGSTGSSSGSAAPSCG
jgi:protein-disulfide isomerase